MRRPASHSQSSSDLAELETTAPTPSVDAEITWLLHRAAQRLRVATSERAEQQGLNLREYIVLSALDKTPDLTQGDLGKALGLDKTTLMSQLDRLESRGLVIRRPDPHDRRARRPEITEAGDALRAQVAEACAEVETTTLERFSDEEVEVFRRMLFEIIGNSQDPGSCL